MQVAYAIGAYKRADLPQLRVVNLYVESSPASKDVGVVLLPRPALRPYLTVGSGPIRGVFNDPGALGGSLFAVSGSALYNGSTSIGAIAGALRVSMASSTTQLLIANDNALQITEGETVDAVVFPDDAAVGSVAFLNGYFLASRLGTQQFYWSTVLDGSAWDGLDYASAESSPDPIVALFVVSDQLWIFKQRRIEIWTSTGDGTTPFLRLDGRLFDKGCMARDTIVRGDNTVSWVGHDGLVYRGGDAPLRISDYGIEEAIKNSDPDNMRAWGYAWNGHTFYVLRTDVGTFAYDYSTQQWAEVASYGRDAWRAHLGTLYDGDIVAGDDETGDIWKLADDLFMDGDDPISTEFTAYVTVDSPAPCDNIVVDASVGKATEYTDAFVMEMRHSRDDGQTWVDWQPVSLGDRGNGRARLAWRRQGVIDASNRLFHWRTTDPTFRRLTSISVNQSMAGRAR